MVQERKPKFETLSGIEAKRVYQPEDGVQKYDEKLGVPGEFPFTRGIQSTMYRGRFWTMRQYAGYASADESNARYKYLLAQGQTGLSVAFDLPTQTGYDSDAVMAEGEVGKVGVAISSLEDMERLFDGIPLGKVSTSMTINSTASILLSLYVAVAKKQGVDPKEIRGTVQGGFLRVQVRDTGVGIRPEDLPRIYDEFFRAEDTRTREIRGTGLGLAITRKIVESHQGRIEVESMPGAGTTFTVFLPLASG